MARVEIRERTGLGTAPDGLSSNESRLIAGALHAPGALSPVDPEAPFRLLRLELPATWLAASLAQERDHGHLFLWLPVCMGAGAAWWFAADAPLAFSALVACCSVMLVALLVCGPHRPAARGVFTACFCLGLGAASADVETRRRDTILLDTPVTTTIRGVVRGYESDGEGRWRYDLALVETAEPRLRRMPRTILATGPGGDVLPLGTGIEGRARLSPPSGPVLPGGNDFAFDAYFSGVGGYGYFYGRPKSWRAPDNVGIVDWSDRALMALEALRNGVSARIHAVLPGDAGAFAASMVTDDRRAISKQTTEALRLAGLAHIVAISGLNMALAAGLFFVGFRIVLTASQRIAHVWPVKRIAAAGALVTVTGYYLISGFAVSAERAYVMMAIMLGAAILGRPSISLRNVALSALIILAITPSAIMSPGFQMSYAATLALVVGYTSWLRRAEQPSAPAIAPLLRPLAWVWRFMAGVFATSLIGGLSTALYSAEHFNRLAAWGLPANLLAMPVISFVVMPAGLVALMLMPFGLDWLPLKLMGLGLDWVIAVAQWAASLGGDIVTGQLPDWLFVGFTVGLLCLSLLRSRLRLGGAALCCGCLLVYWLSPAPGPPLLLLHEDGRLAALPQETALAVSESRPPAFVLDQWKKALRRNRVLAPVETETLEIPAGRGPLPEALLQKAENLLEDIVQTAPGNLFRCEKKAFCYIVLQGKFKVIFVQRAAFAGMACDRADLVVASARLPWSACRSGARLITLDTLRKTGSLEIRRDDNGAIVLTPSVSSLTRPWRRHRAYDWRKDAYDDE